MAEFQEVFKIMRSICHQHENCNECPAFTDDLVCLFDVTNKQYGADTAEKLALAYQNYDMFPTWEQWQKMQFPNFEKYVCPRVFGSNEEVGCTKSPTCNNECRNKHIPEYIAKKLGIKPFEHSNEV